MRFLTVIGESHVSKKRKKSILFKESNVMALRDIFVWA
jgi:hypothetical protein